MARISDEELERLKAEVSLVRLVEERGIALRGRGRDLVGLCPFHDDREPSLVISPAKNLWHCLGACAEGGSVIDWVMRAEGVSFRHAVELLRAGMPGGVSSGPPPARSSTTRLGSPLDVSAEDAELLSQVVAFYHETLTESSEALAYLERRRIGRREAIEHFQLGYANRTLAYRLPNKQRRDGAELRGRLQALGVLRASGHEHFAGSLVIPVIDTAGVVREVYGRKVRDDLRPGTPAHLYLPGPHAGVFNAEGIAGVAEVVVCESLIDALTFWCAGFRHVTAAYGVEGFAAELHDALVASGAGRVLIAYDRDDAGDRAADALAARLAAEGLECFRVQFPAGSDANAYACAAGSPTDVLGQALRAAVWMGGAHPTNQPAAAPTEAAKGEAEPAPAVPSFAAELLPAASPVPAPPEGPAGELVGDELRIVMGERRWRVRGLAKVTSFELLRLNVMVARADAVDRFHVDTFDLYSARARAVFAKAAAEELRVGEDIIKTDLGRVLLACEERAADAVAAALTPAVPVIEMSAEEERAALELLKDPQLIGRIAADVARVGVVGEATNALVAYLAAVSRKLDAPLAVIVQSTSAAGKSALMEAVLALVPAEDRVSYSAMTGQSLFYMGETELAHKVLAVAEEEGASRAAYALKLLQSEGRLSIASTGKDPASGRLVTHTYTVAGPTAILLTTTAVDVDEELLNRCLVLTVDEDRDQTRAIHAAQRAKETLEGRLAAAERERTLTLHHNAQRLLAPLVVANPWAPRLTFTDGRTRTRRDHTKYLTLIRAVTLLHQHQRPRQSAVVDGRTVTYIEATLDDVAVANRLAHEVLGRSLDELAPQTRRLLELLDDTVTSLAAERAVLREGVLLSRRELRERLGWGDTQLKVHLARLVDLELVVAHRDTPGGPLRYELAWDGAGRDGGRFLVGLTDPATLTQVAVAYGCDDSRSGSNGSRSGSGRPLVGGRSGGGRGTPNGERALSGNGSHHPSPSGDENRTDIGDDGVTVVVTAAAGGGR